MSAQQAAAASAAGRSIDFHLPVFFMTGPRVTEAVAEAVAAPVEAVKEKKTRKRARKTEMTFVIQSPFGGEITPEEIRARIGEADAVYIRVDQNKAYWVKGDENGDIDLW